MKPFAADIRQHDTHSTLARLTGSRGAPLALLKLDAIIIPASRPAAHLDHAVTLARAAGCWLLVVGSQELDTTEARKFLAARSCHKAIVVDLPPGYTHELLHFPGLQSIKDELPPACSLFSTDLSTKRNVGLILARMMGWRRIFFLDDDIRDITYPDLQTTVNMLGSYSAAGLWVTDFPDNSIVCHANRMTEADQDVFVSGAALAVNCDADIGFFPDIYNEDWLFFFDDAANGLLANSCLKATQLCYYPFANAWRAAWQEFGDVIAEGLYTLLHLGMKVEQATSDYWSHFLEARRNFLEAIVTRSASAHPDICEDMLESVRSARKSLLIIKPDFCERYVRLWRQDLADWKRRVARIPSVPSIDAALTEMRLAVPGPASGTGRYLLRPPKEPSAMTPGVVGIPRFDTLKELSERASMLSFGSASPEPEVGDTKPFPVLTSEYSEAMLAAKTNGGYSPWCSAGTGGRQRRQLLGSAVSWLRNARPRRRADLSVNPPGGSESAEFSEAPVPDAGAPAHC